MSAPSPLDFDADLTVAVGRDTARVTGRGRHVVVAVPTVAAAVRLARVLARPADRGRLLGSVQRALQAADVAVDVRVRGHTVARLGPGAAARWPFRVGPVQLHPMRALFSLVTGRNE